MRLRRSKSRGAAGREPGAPSEAAPSEDSSASMNTSESRGERTEPIVTMTQWPVVGGACRKKAELLDDLGDDAGADRFAALADGETHLLFQRHARDELDFH